MRTVEEVRGRHLKTLGRALERPAMSGGSASCAELLLRGLLRDLCFIDRREADWDVAAARYLRGCRGVCGQLEFQHRPFPNFVNEVTSVYAEVAFALGYFAPGRLLSEDEMVRLRSATGAEFLERDWDEQELHETFGPP